MGYFTVYFKSGWRWMLYGANHEVVAISEPYESEAAAIGGARAVQRIAPGADIRRPVSR